MSPNLPDILSELKQRLERLYEARLVRVLLYGSHARGNATPESDIDVLVVLAGETDVCAEIARTLDDVAELSLRHDVVISCMFTSRDEYEHGGMPLIRNVRREAVPV